MYGLVNRAIEGLAISAGGQECWDAIRSRAGIEDPTFLSMESYDDEITFALVGAASEVLELPPEQILNSFGEYWVKFTVVQGYGAFLNSAGTNILEFVENLDRMHSQIAATMPHLNPPSFAVDPIGPNEVRVNYFSKRNGLVPMIEGLFNGLADRFGQKIELEVLETSPGATASFRLKVLEESCVTT